MYSIIDFQTEYDTITLNSLLGKTCDFSKLREICRDLGNSIDFDFQVDAEDAIFWKNCKKFSRELFKLS